MSEPYYKPCRELSVCNELIEKHFNTQQYKKCFEGHLTLAEQGYPLAECQIGYFYYDGLGVEKDLAIEKCKELGVDLNASLVDCTEAVCGNGESAERDDGSIGNHLVDQGRRRRYAYRGNFAMLTIYNDGTVKNNLKQNMCLTFTVDDVESLFISGVFHKRVF